jgi:RHS repeat-associated protein
VENKDPYKNGGWVAWVLLEIDSPDGSVYKSSFPEYITATSHSSDVTKNVGGTAVCPCQKGGEGSSNASSGARGGAGEDAIDGQPVGPFTVQESDPINTATGNKYQQDTDFRGSSWLTFRRFYNSIGYVSQTELGPQWRHSFDRSLEFIELYGDTHASTIYLYRPDATRETFSYTNGVWTAEADSADTLTENVDANGKVTGYTVMMAALRHIEDYDSNGLLQSVTDFTGQGISLAYSNVSTPVTVAPKSNLLLTVTDMQGRQLSFTYASNGNLAKVTLPDGGTLIYGYDPSSGLLTSVQYPDGKSRQYVYNESSLTGGGPLPNALTGVFDEAGVRYETTGYSYSGSGVAVSSTFAGGADASSIESEQMQGFVTTPLGASLTFYFKNALGALKPSSSNKFCGLQCNQTQQEITYDTNGYPASMTDFKNVITKTTYDANGLLDQQIDASGTTSQRTTTTTWNIPLRVPLTRTVVDNNGNTVAQMAWVYNAAGQPTAQCRMDPTIAAASSYTCATTGTPPSGVRRSTATYCTAVDTVQCPIVGLLLTTTGPRTDLTDVTTYAYYLTDSATAKHGDLQSITDALGHVTTYASYDGAGRVTRTIDPNGVITDVTYTPRGWLQTKTVRALASGAASSADATTTIAYTAYGAVSSVTDADGVVTTYGYDAAHRLTSITDALGNTIQYTLDASGNRTKEQTFTAAGVATRTLSRKFNTLGQLTAITDGLNQTVFNAGTSGNYDANGNLVQSADALGYQRKRGYDALNRLVSTIDNYNGTDTATKNTTSSMTYDALDRLTGVTDPSSLTTTYTYDGLGNGKTLQSPDTGTSTDTFDAAGNRLTHTDAKGVVSTSTYDALDRPSSTSYTDTTLNVAYHYDEANAVTGCSVSSPVGRLTRVVENAVTTTYCYDIRGNVIQKRQQLGTTLDTTSYSYTLADRLQTTVNPDSTATTYSRDADGRVTSIAVSPPMGAAVTAVNAIAYRPFGPVSSYTLGNGQVITRTYDANDALTDLTSPALNLHFARDAMGNITAEGAAAGANPATETYSYDPLYRLTAIADGTTAVEGLTYNPTGDRLSKTGSGLAVGAYAYTSGTHRLSSIGTAARTSDANGNTTASASAGQTWGYGYNGRNRLTVVQANGSTVGTYTYNAMGQRIQKVATSPTAITQRYAYDEQSHLIGEYASANNRDTIWLGDVPVATVDTAGATSTIAYVTADQLGTPRAVSNSAGVTIWSWPYVGNAFEELSPTSTNGYVLNLRSAGEYYDAESGLNNNGYRTREQSSWRFLQSDPTGLQGGISTYAAIQNSPLMGVDPQGLQTLPPSTYQIDWANPATRAAGAQYALNLVPGYGLYNCASYCCGGWGWTFASLSILPSMGAISGIQREIRAAGTICSAAKSEVNVYRVFGGDARAEGFSWTTIDPRTVSNFRDAAGLPSGGASGSINTADFLIEGKANITDIINSRSALPLDGNAGGLPELIVDPKNVNIVRFSVIKP